ncbi:DUF6094 domain-containing protein [Desertibacillus haloalkaliphilus]|uniref:DUF6094 domain-containing protein n=1 Tax=Desertibacillus haloalkaliphilus TaxID=1328930 RepID=UPI001C279ED7|nr:DUF6094 domain-containing protein [Desertibacillus haloalkaliphilus]MBU8908171.1 class I SAM-dependent methyltransferase [Desertibacillus haloalkaliphilus]
MARLASQAKGGFYATEQYEVHNVARGLQFESKKSSDLINMLDPCAGEGVALQTLADAMATKGAKPVSYGIELEKDRAKASSERLDHVVCDGYENVRTEANYTAMWLNPPYDEVFHERTELRFLRTLTSKSKNVLVPKGLLMFCVPQYVLKPCATILSSRFHDVKVYRFTDDHYPIFKQVVVFGYFGRPSSEERKKTNKYLREISGEGPEVLPTTDEITDGEFVVCDSEDSIQLFRAGRLNISELAKDLASSTLKAEAEKRFSPSEHQVSMKNPILPLKPTHGGIAVASGAIGGNMGSHMITGITKQVTEKKNITNDEGQTTHEEYTKHYKSVVRVFSPEYGVTDLE